MYKKGQSTQVCTKVNKREKELRSIKATSIKQIRHDSPLFNVEDLEGKE